MDNRLAGQIDRPGPSFALSKNGCNVRTEERERKSESMLNVRVCEL